MTLFYDNLWKKKMPRLEALRQAQLALLNGTNLQWDALQRYAEQVIDRLERQAQMTAEPYQLFRQGR